MEYKRGDIGDLYRGGWRSVFAAADADNEAHVADAAHDVGEVNTIVHTDTQVNHTVMRIPLLHIDMLNTGALLGDARGKGCNNTAL